ncbi:MAG: hypothetical protein Q9217_002438 [Psora testacea]
MPSAIHASSMAPQPEINAPLHLGRLNGLPRLVPRKRAHPPQNPFPVPETPPLPPPPDLESLPFEEPSRRILSPHDHELFLSSPTYALILSFVFSLSESAADKKISSVSTISREPQILRLLSILDAIGDLILRCPPQDQGGSRFGNPAFRAFIDTVSSSGQAWHQQLGLRSTACIQEVASYLNHSFGDRARIDYGSGHELNFIIWLLCLNRLSLLPSTSFPALALVVFPRYIKLLRKLQSTYYLEPAGSHGVWGLDDYHFLPFLFGASQLLHHPYIRPLSIHNEVILEEEGDEYLYLDMIRFTMVSKTVKGLKWTQPMLDDISGAKNWEKVEQGMRRMLVKEVLGKLPIMQHFLFGSMVPAAEGMGKECNMGLVPKSEEYESNEVAVHKEGAKHVHRGDEWGDCCGIKIPSTVAASQEEKRKGERDALRRVPFD